MRHESRISASFTCMTQFCEL